MLSLTMEQVDALLLAPADDDEEFERLGASHDHSHAATGPVLDDGRPPTDRNRTAACHQFVRGTRISHHGHLEPDSRA